AHAELRLVAGRAAGPRALHRPDRVPRHHARAACGGGVDAAGDRHHRRRSIPLRGVPYAAYALRRRRRALLRRAREPRARALGLAPRATRLWRESQAHRGAARAHSSTTLTGWWSEARLSPSIEIERSRGARSS